MAGHVCCYQQEMDVSWSQTFETELDTSLTELATSSTELEASSRLPLRSEIDLATGFGVTAT
jgi:hypothetical protein